MDGSGYGERSAISKRINALIILVRNSDVNNRWKIIYMIRITPRTFVIIRVKIELDVDLVKETEVLEPSEDL